jgi:glycosyltransferase involved in cell wall biosynthesis
MNGILLVGALPPPQGGVATHVRRLERALRARGVDVRAIDPRRRGPDGRDGRPRLLAALVAAAAHGRLVHVHTNGHNPKSWALAALCAAARRPSLLTLHSGLAPDFMRAHQKWVRFLCNRFTHVIAVNAELAAALAHAGVDAARVVVCPAYAPVAGELALAPPGLRAIRRRHPLLLACMLAPGREYGADVLLDGFARVRARRPDAGLLIYGPQTRTPALADELARRRLDGVYLMGELERERALAVLRAADVFLRPTRADGDALSVREALESGCVVVASAVGARPPEAALFPSGDAAALVETLFHAVGNRGERKAPPTSAPDCVPTLYALYRRLGLAVAPVAEAGTPLATWTSARRPGTGCAASPAG